MDEQRRQWRREVSDGCWAKAMGELGDGTAGSTVGELSEGAAGRIRRWCGRRCNFCPFKSELLHLSFFQAQQFHAGLHGAVKALSKDSELVKIGEGEEADGGAKVGPGGCAGKGILKESEDFHEEAMPTPIYMLGPWWISGLGGEFGKQFLLDLGEADYGLGYQDA
nr:hypothetical protein Iba_chr04fCG11290 [Ipomoea batatas]